MTFTKQRTLAFLMALIMVLSLLPTSVFAADEGDTDDGGAATPASCTCSTFCESVGNADCAICSVDYMQCTWNCGHGRDYRNDDCGQCFELFVGGKYTYLLESLTNQASNAADAVIEITGFRSWYNNLDSNQLKYVSAETVTKLQELEAAVEAFYNGTTDTHEHSFVFSVSDDQANGIVQTCSSEGCDYRGAAAWAYIPPGGIQITADTTWTGGNPIPVYYYGDTQLDGEPTEEGDYTAKITVGEATAVVTFTIEHTHDYTYDGTGTNTVIRVCSECNAFGSLTLMYDVGTQSVTVTGNAYGNWIPTGTVTVKNAAGETVTDYSQPGSYAASYTENGEVILNITFNVEHACSFSYAADGAEITRTCSLEGCSLSSATAKLVFDDYTQMVSAQYSENWTAAEPQIYYYQVGENGAESALGTDVPLDAGEYIARLTVSDCVAELAFTVTHIHQYTYEAVGNTITVGCIVQDDCDMADGTAVISYDAEKKAAVVTYDANWVGMQNLPITYTGENYSSTTTAPTVPGTYTATVTFDEYTAASVEFTIACDHYLSVAIVASGDYQALEQRCSGCDHVAFANVTVSPLGEVDYNQPDGWIGELPVVHYYEGDTDLGTTAPTKEATFTVKLVWGELIAAGNSYTIDHTYTYDVSGAVVNESCAGCDHEATAELTRSDDNTFAMDYDEDWQGARDFVITIKKDGAVVGAVTDGSYVVTAVSGSLTATLEFEIEHVCSYVYSNSADDNYTVVYETCVAEYPCDHKETARLYYNSTDVYVAVQFSSGWQGGEEHGELIFTKDGYNSEGFTGNGAYHVETFVQSRHLQLDFTVNCAHDSMVYEVNPNYAAGLIQTCAVCGHEANGSLYYYENSNAAYFTHSDAWVTFGEEPVPQFYQGETLVGPTLTEGGTYSLRLTLGDATAVMDNIVVDHAHKYTYVVNNAASITRSCDVCGIGATLTLTRLVRDGAVMLYSSNSSEWYSMNQVTVTDAAGNTETGMVVFVTEPGTYTARCEEVGYTWKLEFTVEHQCSFTYELSEDGTTVTRTCSVEGCPYSGATAKLVQEDTTQLATAEFSDNWQEEMTHVQYFAAEGDGWATTSATPTASGNYLATLSVYTGSEVLVAQKEFSFEHTHSYTYTASGNVITESCTCGHSETAALSYDEDYNVGGMHFSNGWVDRSTFSAVFYQNGVALDGSPTAVGAYTLKATIQGATAELDVNVTHIHDFTYTLDGASVTGKCSGCDKYGTVSLVYSEDINMVIVDLPMDEFWIDDYWFYPVTVTQLGETVTTITTGKYTATCEIMGLTAVLDFEVPHTCVYGYTASGNVITEACTACATCDHQATATITYDTAKKAALVTTDDGWQGGELTVAYTGTDDYNSSTAPTGEGSYTASITKYGAIASVAFEIDHVCVLTYAKAENGSGLVETCAAAKPCDHKATAVLSYNDTTKCVDVRYSSDWEGERPAVTYSWGGNPLDALEGPNDYTAHLTVGGVTADYDFTLTCDHENMTYTAVKNILTQSCICGHTGSMEIMYDDWRNTYTSAGDMFIGDEDLVPVFYKDEVPLPGNPTELGDHELRLTVGGATAVYAFTITHLHKLALTVDGNTITGVCSCGKTGTLTLEYSESQGCVTLNMTSGWFWTADWTDYAITVTQLGQTVENSSTGITLGKYVATADVEDQIVTLEFEIPHTCAYGYTAYGNVITERCTACVTCDHEETATVTYAGEKQAAVVTTSDGWQGGAMTVTYTDADNQKSTEVPVTEGTYTAAITVGEATASAVGVVTHECAYSYTASGNVMIERCTCGHKETAIITYDGNRCVAVVTTSAGWQGGEMAVSYDDGETAVPTASGSHTAYATGQDLTISVDFSIAAVTVAAPTVTKPDDSAVTLSDVSVSGLNGLAEAEAPAESTDPNVTTTVTVEVAVEYIDTSATEEVKKDVAAMESSEENTSSKLDVIEITVEKTTTTTTTDDTGEADSKVEETTEVVSDTNRVLELCVSYSFAGKMNVTVYRNHEGNVEAFGNLPERPMDAADYQDATAFCDTANNRIYIYTQYFSVYGFGYDEARTITYVDGSDVYTEEYAVGKGTSDLYAPVKTGYTLAWYDAATDGSLVTAIGTDATGNITLYARWTPNTYTVTFEKQGGTGTAADLSVTYNAAYGTLPVLDAWAGYEFLGWFTESTGGTEVKADTVVNTAADHTLYAQWKQVIFNVTLDANGGSGCESSITGNYGDALPGKDVMTRTGYTFVEWQDAQGKAVTTITADGTLTAVWEANTYTVTLDANGGSGSAKSITVTYDGKYENLPGANVMQRTGYTFAGWKLETKAKATTLVTADTVVSTAADHTLVAQWTANTYTVTFDKQGGTGTADAKTVTYDSAYGTLPTVTKTDLYFAGWYTAASGGTKVTADSVVNVAADHVLYAHWSTVPVTGDEVSMGQMAILSGALLVSLAALTAIVIYKKKRD